MSRLVIAEKPSVAQSLSAVLGATNRRDGCLEGGYLVSWCFGHLAELSDASAYNLFYPQIGVGKRLDGGRRRPVP